MERKVRVNNLKIGMYVVNLDRPWLDTPFLVQGFHIRDNEELRALNKYCKHVFIDPDMGQQAEIYMDQDPQLPTNEYLERFLRDRKREVEYTDAKTASEEIPAAKSALEDASEKISLIMEDVKAGKNLNIKAVRSVVEPILDSIIRNPDALMWLTRLKSKDEYTYSHSVDNCSLAIAFGRHMGLPKEDMWTLAMGTLLLDAGKMRIPDELLNKRTRLTDDEFEEVKKHVDYSVEILKQTDGISEDVINIALTHHERFDGSGYPNGIEGTHIPVYGRMAAIIDCFDAMTSRRPYSEPISAHKALQKIYNWRNVYFQDELVEQFLQCLGVYPTGSLVEMSSGEVGIILSQNRTRRLKPKIMLLLDEQKKAYDNFKVIDLMVQTTDANGHDLTILRGLDPGAYGIDPTEFYL